MQNTTPHHWLEMKCIRTFTKNITLLWSYFFFLQMQREHFLKYTRCALVVKKQTIQILFRIPNLLKSPTQSLNKNNIQKSLWLITWIWLQIITSLVPKLRRDTTKQRNLIQLNYYLFVFWQQNLKNSNTNRPIFYDNTLNKT